MKLVCNCEALDKCTKPAHRCNQLWHEWNRNQEYFCDCLQAFHGSAYKTTNQLNVLPHRNYPLNVSDNKGSPIGWLLHGQGRNVEMVEKDIALELRDSYLERVQKQVIIYPFSVTGTISAENVFRQPVDITDARVDNQHNVARDARGPEVVVQEIS